MFIPNLFLEILQRYCKLVILSSLDLPGHTHQKRLQQLVGNSDCYLQIKNQFDPSIVSRNITL